MMPKRNVHIATNCARVKRFSSVVIRNIVQSIFDAVGLAGVEVAVGHSGGVTSDSAASIDVLGSSTEDTIALVIFPGMHPLGEIGPKATTSEPNVSNLPNALHDIVRSAAVT
jgi:hypothetical protein